VPATLPHQNQSAASEPGQLGASGALAAVVAGLVTGHQSPGFLAARDRLAETVNWETVAFLLESGIFRRLEHVVELLNQLKPRTLTDVHALV
jgi:hypothetical protein